MPARRAPLPRALLALAVWLLAVLPACGLGGVGPDYAALHRYRAMDVLHSPDVATDSSVDAVPDKVSPADTTSDAPGPQDADVADSTADVPPPACQTATDCQDGNACITGRDCASGSCTSGAPLSCDDGDLCTDDSCVAASGCAHVPTSCDDGNVCTDDSCVASVGCSHVANTSTCDDANACTLGDACSGAKCAYSKTLSCDDGNVCTIDFCDPKKGCQHSSASGYCTDGDACTNGDVCLAGACTAGTPAQCAPSTACSLSACDKAKGCTLTPQPDGMGCGGTSFCHAGNCVEPWASAVSVGTLHACAASPAGTVSCWGANMFGQLGNSEMSSSDAPVLASLPAAGAVRCGSGHCCALTGPASAPTVKCWGLDIHLQTGDSKGSSDVQPFTVTLPGVVTDVVAAQEHSCALASTGAVYCWGTNNAYELGIAQFGTDLAAPQLVSGAPPLLAIAAGTHTTCGRDAGGTLWCWGNLAGTWGGLATAYGAPTPVKGLGPVTGMGLADAHACAVLAAGDLVCWGTNATGELGNGSTGTPYAAPTKVLLAAPVAALALGKSHTCAMTTSGAVWCWGSHAHGQLGVGTVLSPANASAVPLQIPDLQAVALTAIDDRTCAVRVDGAVVCWGKVPSGSVSFVPVAVPGTTP